MAAATIWQAQVVEAGTTIQVPDLRPSNMPHYPSHAELLREARQPWDPTGRMTMLGYGMFVRRWLLFGWMLWRAVGPM